MSRKIKILFLGPLPPPHMGMSIVNEYLINLLKKKYDIEAISINSERLNHHSLFSRFIKFFKFFNSLNKIIISLALYRNNIKYIFLSLSGGAGKFFDILYLFLFKLFNLKIIIHHHSLKHFDNSILLSYLLRISKNNEHIVLCSNMKNKLESFSIKNIHIISNSLIIEEKTNQSFKKKLKYIGYLGNIETQKGIYDFIKIANYYEKKNTNFKFLIAGPFKNYSEKKKYNELINDLSNTDYLGKLLNQEKEKFYKKIDLLIYPTKNDAEPLVILESMSFGIPIIATNIGCINNLIIEEKNGRLVNDNFVDKSIKLINELAIDKEMISHYSKNAYKRFSELKSTSLKSFSNL